MNAVSITPESNNLEVKRRTDEDDATAVTRTVLSPEFHSSRVAGYFIENKLSENVTLMSLLKVFQSKATKLASNDLSDVEANLLSQAISLDVIYSELARRAANNMGENFTIMEGYLKLAFKAQNQSRMTLETLGNIKNPPAVFAKQANINNGGQQQVNNGVDPHAPATENQTRPSKLVEQSNETPMDKATEGSAGQPDSQLETLASFVGTSNT